MQNIQNKHGVSQMMMEVCAAGAGVAPVVSGQTPGSLGLNSTVDGNWIQECTDWNQDCRKENRQDLQMSAVNEETKTLVIP